jgi:hypothetical protein
MMPATSALSPATFSTMLVIGATVVTTFNFCAPGARLGSFLWQLKLSKSNGRVINPINRMRMIA